MNLQGEQLQVRGSMFRVDRLLQKFDVNLNVVAAVDTGKFKNTVKVSIRLKLGLE